MKRFKPTYEIIEGNIIASIRRLPTHELEAHVMSAFARDIGRMAVEIGVDKVITELGSDAIQATTLKLSAIEGHKALMRNIERGIAEAMAELGPQIVPFDEHPAGMPEAEAAKIKNDLIERIKK